MKKTLNNIICVIVIFSTISCSDKSKEYNVKFIDQFGNETFDQFVNSGLSLRNLDIEGKAVVFISDLKVSKMNGPYIIHIDTNTLAITQTSSSLVKDTSLINFEKFEDLSREFIKYNVFHLSVDSTKNVYVNAAQANQRPSLVRFSDMKYKSEFYKDWHHIRGNWYEDDLNP